MSGLIANSKIGNCTVCNATNTECRKRQKDLICLSCCRTQDIKKQLYKQSEKSKVRGLQTYQKVEGIIDSTQELIIDLDRVVSKYVRLAAMGKDRKCECYTCGSKRDWTKMQCGHFISRSHLATRWELANLRVQCPVCNVNDYGNLAQYEAYLEEEHKGITEWLKEQSRIVYSPSRDELKQLLFDFQQRLKLVETKLT